MWEVFGRWSLKGQPWDVCTARMLVVICRCLREHSNNVVWARSGDTSGAGIGQHGTRDSSTRYGSCTGTGVVAFGNAALRPRCLTQYAHPLPQPQLLLPHNVPHDGPCGGKEGVHLLGRGPWRRGAQGRVGRLSMWKEVPLVKRAGVWVPACRTLNCCQVGCGARVSCQRHCNGPNLPPS